jgi:hypothetical protein
MALICMVSPGGSPGVTTSALLMGLAWPERVLIAECDITGASLLTGLFGGHAWSDRGLLAVAMAVADGPAVSSQSLWDQTVAVDSAGLRPALPGPADPFQARVITTQTWRRLAELFTCLECDVIADVGQVLADPAFPGPLVAAADAIVMVLRPCLRQVVAAHSRLDRLRQAVGEGVPIVLCVIGRGPHRTEEVTSALGPVAATLMLPHDARTARRLSDGTGRRDIRHSELLLHAPRVARRLRTIATSPVPLPPHSSPIVGEQP